MANMTLTSNTDAHERDNSTFFDDTNASIRMDDHTTQSSRFNGGVEVVTTSEIPSGATIDSCYITFECNGTEAPEVTIYGDDIADAASFAVEATVTDRSPRTTANVVWSTTGLTGSQNSPELKTIIQELVDTYSGIASGDSICLLLISNGSGTTTFRVNSVDGTTAPTVYIEWTPAAAGGDSNASLIATKRQRQTYIRM